jgi:hypothetical protein
VLFSFSYLANLSGSARFRYNPLWESRKMLDLKLPNEKVITGSHKVRVHTPDPNKYHSVGGVTMLPHVGGSLTANKDTGKSPAFRVTDKRPAYVDPENPYTGEGALAIVDTEGVEQSVESFQADLSAPAQEQAVTQTIPAMPPVHRVPVAAPPAASSETSALTGVVAELIHEMRMARLSPGEMTPVERALQDFAADERRYNSAPREGQTKDREVSEQTYEKIGMPWLGVNGPLKPTVKVAFHYAHGLQRTRYWDVQHRDRCIVVALDDRSDDDLFMPGTSTKPVRMVVPDRKIDEWVRNPDVAFTIGQVTYLILFVRPDDAEVSDEEEAEEDDD